MLRVLVDFLCSKERKVEISGGETEGAAVIAAKYVDVGCVAVDTLCPPYTGEAVVIGRDRQRPVAGNGVVVGKQLSRATRRREGIIALVDHVIDAHEAPPRASRELPDTRCTHV